MVAPWFDSNPKLAKGPFIEEYSDIQADKVKPRWKFEHFVASAWDKTKANTLSLPSQKSYLSTDQYFRTLKNGLILWQYYFFYKIQC